MRTRMGVFFLFLLATSLGSLSTLYWIPEEDLGRGYFQMNALVVLGLLSLAVRWWCSPPFIPSEAGPVLAGPLSPRPSSGPSSTTPRSGRSAGGSAAGP